MRLYSEVDVAQQPDNCRNHHQFDDECPICPHPALIPGQQSTGNDDDSKVGITANGLTLEDILQVTVGIVVGWYGKTAPLVNCQERVEWSSHK